MSYLSHGQWISEKKYKEVLTHGFNSISCLYEVIEDIVPFVLNTKRPLSDILLLNYKQIFFVVFFDKIEILFF